MVQILLILGTSCIYWCRSFWTSSYGYQELMQVRKADIKRIMKLEEQQIRDQRWQSKVRSRAG